MRLVIPLFLFLAIVVPGWADGLEDNDPANVRPVPPPGIDVPASTRNELEMELAKLDALIEQLDGKVDPELVPDVEIFARAVRSALIHNEFTDILTTKTLPARIWCCLALLERIPSS